MASRVSLPGEFYLDAIVVDPVAGIRRAIADAGNRVDWAQPAQFDDSVIVRARERGPFIALRWVLNAALGMPLEPFTVWRRSAGRRETALPIPNWKQAGNNFWWDGLTEMMRIELDVTAQVRVDGLSRADHDPVATVTDGPGTIVLQNGPMLGVRVSDPNAVTFARGLSLTTMANGNGWTAIERVGLPLVPSLETVSYYDARKQGPMIALTDPLSAAVQRIDRWAPTYGWAPLSGLPPWVVPNTKQLIAEFGADLLPDLVAILQAHPAPNVDAQRTAEGACWRLVDCGAISIQSTNNNRFTWPRCANALDSLTSDRQRLVVNCIAASTCDELRVQGSPGNPNTGQMHCLRFGGL